MNSLCNELSETINPIDYMIQSMNVNMQRKSVSNKNSCLLTQIYNAIVSISYFLYIKALKRQ